MTVKIATGSELKRERTFINANGKEIPAEEFLGGYAKPDLGAHPGTKGLQSNEKQSS